MSCYLTDHVIFWQLELPEDKPRFLPGIYNPLEIIKAVKLGCDIFESTYPFL